jgi:hypothetical protein
MILYDFCLLCTLFCDSIVRVQNFESLMQFMTQRTPWKIASGVENFILLVLLFQKMAVFCRFPGWVAILAIESLMEVWFIVCA